MSTNDRALLDGILESRRRVVASDMPEDKFFELFLAEQLLWARNLSWEELLDGIMGGGGDGGIDAIYIFQNGTLVTPDMQPMESRGPVEFELFVIQAKRTASFGETAVDKLHRTLSDLFNFENDLEGMGRYNEDLLDMARQFRNSYVTNASNFPRVAINVFYGTRGFEVHPNVLGKAKDLERGLVGLFSAVECTFTFVTPSELVGMARRQRPTTLDLRVKEVMATTTGGWIALVDLDSYFSFVSTEQGDLRSSIFDSNVRDYEGNAKINASIRATLNKGEGDDFWWLNNGITIVSTRAGQSGKILTLEYPQIVNGLQTTREIHCFIGEQRRIGRASNNADNRTVLIRVVVPPSDASRDRIIRATNSQTPIPSVALRATDKIQRDIEEYFFQNGFFYERRKNQYKNEGKPIARIITIPYLAEAVMAVLLHEPHLGKLRFGGGFLREDDTYNRIFDPSTPLPDFLKSVKLVQSVERRIEASDEAGIVRRRARMEKRGTYSADELDRFSSRIRRDNTRYILPTAMVISIISKELERLDLDDIPTSLIDACEDLCISVDTSTSKRGKGGADVRFAHALIEAIPDMEVPEMT